MGVDYGLKKQCVRTLSPTAPNFYFDDVDCPGTSYPTWNTWLTIVEIENYGTFGFGCTGPFDQSVLINGPGSPVTENWVGSPTTGYTLELKADYRSIVNPCAAPTWTYVGLSDCECLGVSSYPRPDQFMMQFTVNFNKVAASGAGGVGAVAGIGLTYVGAGSSTPILVDLTVAFFFEPSSLSFGITPGMPPDVIVYAGPSTGSPKYQVYLDGSKLNPPIQTQLSSTTPIAIDWGNVITHLIAEGLIPPPVNGWAASSASATGSGLAFEYRNNVPGTGGPMADMFISNYRESAVFKTLRK